MPKRRRQEPEEEPSEPEEEQEENAGCEPITLDQLLPTITVEQFLAEYWGKKVYVGALSEDSYEAVRSRFCNGDFAAVLAECRKEDNTSYTDSERDEIEAGFRERKATVNQPFNFCDGAEAAPELHRELRGPRKRRRGRGLFLTDGGRDDGLAL